MPLSCKDLVEQSSDYIENSGSVNRLSIRFHLLICHHCRRFVRHKKIANEYLFKQQQLHQISDSNLEQNIDSIMKKINDNNSEPQDTPQQT